MLRPMEVRRAIVLVLDGLRPDAVDAFDLRHVRRLARAGAASMQAQTVLPSLTWPALTSLLTGVAPDVHGILADSLHVPRPRTKLAPLASLLERDGFPCTAFIGDVPRIYRGIAGRLAKGLGFAEARFVGKQAPDVLRGAESTLRGQKRGLIFMHWADADETGHEFGWMSPQYAEAARRLDATLGALVANHHLATDRSTVLVALADHGGGGIDERHHDGDHHLNRTIPLVFAGGAVQQRQLTNVSLLDVPPTIAWALGVPAPASWSGRVVNEAFHQMTSAVTTAMAWPTTTSPG